MSIWKSCSMCNFRFFYGGLSDSIAYVPGIVGVFFKIIRCSVIFEKYCFCRQSPVNLTGQVKNGAGSNRFNSSAKASIVPSLINTDNTSSMAFISYALPPSYLLLSLKLYQMPPDG